MHALKSLQFFKIHLEPAADTPVRQLVGQTGHPAVERHRDNRGVVAVITGLMRSGKGFFWRPPAKSDDQNK